MTPGAVVEFMSLFRSLGRSAERVKRSVTESDDDHDYRCRACEAALDERHETCPDCGGEVGPA